MSLDIENTLINPITMADISLANFDGELQNSIFI